MSNLNGRLRLDPSPPIFAKNAKLTQAIEEAEGAFLKAQSAAEVVRVFKSVSDAVSLTMGKDFFRSDVGALWLQELVAMAQEHRSRINLNQKS